MYKHRPLGQCISLLLFGVLQNVIFDIWSQGLVIHASFASSISKEMMSGLLLRSSAFHYPPMFTIQKLPNGEFLYDGIGPELSNIIAKHLNMTLQFVHVDPSDVTKHGMIRSLLHQLDENEVDLTLYFFEMIPENLWHIDISHPAITAQLVLLQPLPEQETRLKVVIKPFDSVVWAGLFISIIAFILISSFMSFVQQSFEKDYDSVLDQSMRLHFHNQVEYVITTITYQGSYLCYKARTSFRMMVALWLIPTMILLMAYSGVLTSLLTINKLEPPIDTLEQLKDSSNLRLTIEEDMFMTKQFMQATSGTYKAMGDILRQDPQRLFIRDPVQIFDNIINHRCVYLGNVYMVKYLINLDLKTNGKCRMTLGRRPLPNLFAIFQFGHRKGSRYTKFIDQIFIRTVEMGIRDFMMKKYLPPTDQCRMEEKKETRSLTLNDLASAFIALQIGIAAAAIVFIIELMMKHVKKSSVV